MNQSQQFTLDYFKSNLNKEAFENLPKEFSENIDFAFYVIKRDVSLIDFFSDKVLNNDVLVQVLVEIIFLVFLRRVKGCSTFYNKSKLCRNKEFILYAVKRDVDFFKFACENIQDDEEVAMKAIRYNVKAYSYASDRVKNIPCVVDSVLIFKYQSNNGIQYIPTSALTKKVLSEIVKNHREIDITNKQKEDEKVTKKLLMLMERRISRKFGDTLACSRQVIDRLFPKFIKKGYIVDIHYQSSYEYECRLVKNTVNTWAKSMVQTLDRMVSNDVTWYDEEYL